MRKLLPVMLILLLAGCNLNQVITQVRTFEEKVQDAIIEQIGEEMLIMLLALYTNEEVADFVMQEIGPKLKLTEANSDWTKKRIVIPYLEYLRDVLTPEIENARGT